MEEDLELPRVLTDVSAPTPVEKAKKNVDVFFRYSPVTDYQKDYDILLSDDDSDEP